MDRRTDRPSLTSRPQIPENCPVSSTECIRGGSFGVKIARLEPGRCPRGRFGGHRAASRHPAERHPTPKSRWDPWGAFLGVKFKIFQPQEPNMAGGGEDEPPHPDAGGRLAPLRTLATSTLQISCFFMGDSIRSQHFWLVYKYPRL